MSDWIIDIDDEAPATSDTGPEVEVFDVDQNSDEWALLRSTIPTASGFHKIITGGRADSPSSTRHRYMLDILGARLTGEPPANFETVDTRRGHEMEPTAVVDYEFRQNVETQTVGFYRRGQMGASPDRLVVGQPGMVEIKSKKPPIQLGVLLADEMPEEHKDQVQGGLLVTGLEWCDFVSYWPGLPLFVKRIYRDEKYIAWLKGQIDQFNEELDHLERHILSKYYGRAA